MAKEYQKPKVAKGPWSSMDDSISVVVVIVVVVVEVVSHIYCTNYFDKTSNSNLLSLLF